MTTLRITFIALSFSLASAFGQYQLPPLEKSIEDPATGLNLQPGFAAELIYKVDKKKYGSWITLIFDKQGRLIVSDQGGAGVFRMTIPKIGEKFSEENITKLNLKKSVQGFLFAFDHLYAIRFGSLSRAPVSAAGPHAPPSAPKK